MRMVNIHVKHNYALGVFAMPANRGENDRMNITALRRRRGLTQIELAELANLSQPKVSRAERCEDGTTMGTYKRIAEALGVPLHELFSSDRSDVETELLQMFRLLSPDRQKGWLDMARLAAQQDLQPKEQPSAKTEHHPTSKSVK